MRILKTLGYVALAVSGGMLGGRLLAPELPTRLPEIVASQADAATPGAGAVASAETEMAKLRARVATLERRLDPTQAGEPKGGPPQATPTKTEVLTPEERSARRLERFEERFQREPEDHPRDAAAAARVLESLARSEATQDTHPIRVDCRSSMCRIEVEHDSQAAFDRFREELPELLGTGGTYVRLLERGPRFRSLAMHFDKSSG